MTTSKTISTSEGVAVLRRSRRKTLAISVDPDGTLELTAPEDADEEDILQKVQKRSKWIRSQRRWFAEANGKRSTLRYVNGATHRYLGKQYRIKLSKGDETCVSLRGGYFHITVPDPIPEAVQAALDDWFLAKAKEHFARSLASWQTWCHKHRLPSPVLQLRQMPKRWGSASSSGVIRLNPRLIRMPSVCIDYVITHELCHLKHPDHSPQFYRLLTSLMPQWQSVKQRLELAED